MPITKGFRQLVDEAMAEVTTLSVAQVQARMGSADLQIVDIRDPRELEFWVDPASPYFKPVFGDESRQFVLFCGAGWRSALAAKALQDMGMSNVAHIDGGFADWCAQGAPVQTLEEHKAASRPAGKA
jgi:rhodanese-related sulfurtransferase